MWRKPRKEDDPYTDAGRYYKLPDDLSWITSSPYSDTWVYQQEYEVIAKLVSVTRYLSLGSGLGRHIVIAYGCFPYLQSVVSVDHQLFLRESVRRLPIDIRLVRNTIAGAISELHQEGAQPFDFIAVENVREHGLDNISLPALKGLLVAGGLLAFVGDTYPTLGLWSDSDLTNLTGSQAWISVRGLFQKNG